MRLLSVVGARPQFVKVAVIAATLRDRAHDMELDHRILHTGQHYDTGMSDCFFHELHIPEPAYQLAVGSASHGVQTGQMLAGIEAVLAEWRPDAVIVYGDTNSTVAGALAAAKLRIRVIHLEAGLRSFNRFMPEEINRVATDHLSDVLLCPTPTAMANARNEGLEGKCWLTGDVMLDLLLAHSRRLKKHRLARTPFALVTIHRAENTDFPERLADFIRMIERLPLRAIIPMHPRLRSKLCETDLDRLEGMGHVELLGPCEYGEMIALERDAAMILTDSGGVQKEAYFLGVPCLTLRNETEWVETLGGGWNRIVGMSPDKIATIARSLLAGNGYMPTGLPDLQQFGGGAGAQVCVDVMIKFLEGAIG